MKLSPARVASGLQLAATSLFLAASIFSAKADDRVSEGSGYSARGHIVVTESVYAGYASLITPGVTILPTGVTATADGSFPYIFNNAITDSSFGITAPIYLAELTRSGKEVRRLAVPTNLLTTSFSSKSELAIHPAAEGALFTFLGYVAPINTLDVSNSNTPGHFDLSNPVPSTFQRAIGLVDLRGYAWSKPVNAYSGNNGRSVILSDRIYYMVGNAGNGSLKGAQNIVDNTGVQILDFFGGSDSTVVGLQQGNVGDATGYQYGYSVVQNGYTADTSGKDDNFRGEAIFNKTLYVSKGSGSGDQGADPNQLVTIDDKVSFATAAEASGEVFQVLKTAESGTVLRGVAVAPTESED